jgi:Zn-dependent protease with chaperone function
MKQINIFFFVTLTIELFCQQNKITFNEPLTIVANDKVSSEFKKGSKAVVTDMQYSFIDGFTVLGLIGKNIDGSNINIDIKRISNIGFENIDNINKLWDKNLIINGTYANLLEKGFQYDIRNDLNNEAIQYTNTLASNNCFFNDDYFEDYLYTIVNKIHSGILKDQRPGNIFIKVLKDIEPNAFVLPNGCVIISTGLLSTIQSEDELVAILAHEIAHFVLDHHILNYNKEIDRRKKAEFWSTFATIAAASAEVYLAANNKNYVPGLLTTTTAIASSIISEEVITRLGIKYNQSQEMEADKVAKEVLDILNYNKLGLSVALTRIKNYSIITGNFLAISGSGTHPSIESRIDQIGQVEGIEKYTQQSFLKKVSLINSYNAWIELWSYAHHLAAKELADRNIICGVATESDYIVKAIVTRRLSNTTSSNEEVLNLLNKAKQINITPFIIVNKEEGITYLRLQKFEEAKVSLQKYLESLIEVKTKFDLDDKKSRDSIEDEINWTKKMMHKIDNMKDKQ